MKDRSLEITLEYAQDLNNVNLITKMDVYAVVSISGGDDSSTQMTKSPVDHVGDVNPTWNFPTMFTVNEAALQQNRLTLEIKLVCERALRDKDIGEVNVPIKELLDSPVNARGAADGRKFVSYQVRKPSGRPKGQITFSYKFGRKTAAAAAAPPPHVAEVLVGPTETYPTVGHYWAYPPPPPPAQHQSLYPNPVMVEPEGGGLYPPVYASQLIINDTCYSYHPLACGPPAGEYTALASGPHALAGEYNMLASGPLDGYGYRPTLLGYGHLAETPSRYGYSQPPPSPGYSYTPPPSPLMYGYVPTQPRYDYT